MGGKITIKKKDASVAATVSVKHPTGAQEVVEEPVSGFPQVQTKTTAEVGFSAGFTKNLGDFNSARFDVSLKVMCDVELVDETFAKINSWVDERLTQFQEAV